MLEGRGFSLWRRFRVIGIRRGERRGIKRRKEFDQRSNRTKIILMLLVVVLTQSNLLLSATPGPTSLSRKPSSSPLKKAMIPSLGPLVSSRLNDMGACSQRSKGMG